MATYLTFTSQKDADKAQMKLWCNKLLESASNSEYVVGDSQRNDYLLSEIQSMSDSEVCKLRLYGKKNGVIKKTEGITERWDEPRQCYNDSNKWFMKKPNDALLTGVTGYTIEESDPEWWAPIDESNLY